MRLLYCTITLAFSLLTNLLVVGQITVNGPTCVIPGTVYHYKINGTWKASSTMQVCVSGGYIKNKDSSQRACSQTGGSPLGSILVVWNNIGAKTITVTSSEGNSTLSISSINGLQSGSIAASSQKQTLKYDSMASVIICGVDIGGACNPSYYHQWQQSADRVSWTEIVGANDVNLALPDPMKVTTFYRRKVTEKTSGTMAYSDVAAIFVLLDTAISQ